MIADISNWALALAILKVAVGLGLVIFVHELGHFAVAKLCGVKCEKFYLGFDIYGWKFCKFTWGETEYGIGVLPLGGYVKMLGQEDNPGRLKEEMERAKAQREAGDGAAAPKPAEEPVRDVKELEAALYDPRSYLAQTVPERMAIISAGVIMNVIFAFVLAVIAYTMGVRWVECAVGDVHPGEAAFRADIRMDDEIPEIAGQSTRKFRDLQANISLGELDNGVEMVIRRDGKLLEPKIVHPDQTRLIPTIGIVNAWQTTLASKNDPTRAGSPAWAAKPDFERGDQVVAILVDGEETKVQNAVETIGASTQLTSAQIHALLIKYRNQPVQVVVERRADKKTETIEVKPQAVRRLGLVMAMGPVTAVQDGSEAEKRGVKEGDVIKSINGKELGDPITLAERLRCLSEEEPDATISITLTRRVKDGEETDITLEDVRLVQTDRNYTPLFDGGPMAVPSLGITYQVGNKVGSVIPDSPAAEAGIEPGNVLVKATLLPPDKEVLKELDAKQPKLELEFSEEKSNWPFFFHAIQLSLDGSKIELEIEDGDEPIVLELTDEPLLAKGSDQWFRGDPQQWCFPDRGFNFEPRSFLKTAGSFGEALKLGYDETLGSVSQVFGFLRKIGTQVSPKAFGGPVTIAKVAYRFATEGTAQLLIFLTMLSANLAVLNFLPIPLLDGGHFVFLTIEGIRGKPVSERVQIALTYVGLFFLLGLMVWVLGLDFGLISRN